MREIFSPFMSTKKLIHIVVCALIFIVLAVPFKTFILIEGVAETIRPVNALPVVAGLLLGPAGAWGCARGNLVADFWGTLIIASIIGFIANFFAAYLPYKLWHLSGKAEAPNVKSYMNLVKYVVVCVMSAFATAILLTSGLDILFKNWLPNLFWVIFKSHMIFSIVLGLPVFALLTSGKGKIEVTLPEKASDKEEKSLGSIKHLSLILLLLSMIVLSIMLGQGLQTTAYPLMYASSIIFALSLLGLII
jgi:energy-coupling factor transport system substrate-specific component